MKLGITNDHGAVELKNALKTAFPEIEWIDIGVDESMPRVDHPDFALALAKMIEQGQIEKGVALCGTGVGMAMALNRSRAVRAAPVTEPLTAKLVREHNDANVICMGGRMIGQVMAIECLKAFLTTDFLGDRYTKRVEKIS